MMHAADGRPEVLVVDDDEALLRAIVLTLSAKGFRVQTAPSGAAAIQALDKQAFDVILSDVDMPGMSGLALLETVRTRDLDVPVVLITGSPSIDAACASMEHGALRYLVKPVDAQILLKVINDAVRLHRIATAKRQAIELAGGVERFAGDRAGLTGSFDRAMEAFFMVYQPIVSWSRREIFGYETLLRSREASLPHPGAMLDAAERLGRIHDLGRRVREKAVEPLERLPKEIVLFLNLHPSDLLDEDLFSTNTPLARVADRIVLEITERASLDDVRNVRGRIDALRKLGFRIAIDDLGAGYAGLTSFALLDPDVVKLDMALVRDLHTEPTKRTLVRTMIAMSKELGIVVTGEGIETVEERDELALAGCDLMQGYLFARPGEAFPAACF
jgi:EAL domain-containing protein (putative c-di-GMP-specific phosphodiesterase class I)